MSNKEIYDKAVANGLEFTYFHGEDIVPEDFEDTKKETFWEMELESAQKDPQIVLDFYRKDLEFDQEHKDSSVKRIPNFITDSSRSEAAKAVAYDGYADLRYGSNGFGTLDENDNGMDLPYNGNRGFDEYFN